MSSRMTAMRDRLIQQLGLLPHPEGGFYRETYRAAEQMIRRSDNVIRAASTAIYYLLSDDAYSAWHRIRSDELWHFYAGDGLDVHSIAPPSRPQSRPQSHRLCSTGQESEGVLTHRLGNALTDDQAVFQAGVAAGDWFAAERVPGPHGFTLVGCTVAPGFEFSEFELADAARLDTLENAHPTHQALIRRLSANRQ